MKEALHRLFEMKDLGLAKQILGTEIVRGRKSKRLWLSQEKYIEYVLDRFAMKGAKSVSLSLSGHLKLTKRSCPSTS